MNRTVQNQTGTPDGTTSDYVTFISEIIIIVVQVFLVFLGSFIQLKIVLTCLKEKKPITWQLDITHAVAITIFVFFSMIFETIIDQIPFVQEKIGDWICYIASFIYISSIYVFVFHSFGVAFTKYIFIVHTMENRQFGEEKTQKLFFLVNLIHPFILAILTTLTYDFEHSESLISCFGLKEQLLTKYNTSTGNLERVFLCKLGNIGTDKVQMPWFYIIQGFCATRTIWILMLSTNIPEAYFYLKIFKKMRR